MFRSYRTSTERQREYPHRPLEHHRLYPAEISAIWLVESNNKNMARGRTDIVLRIENSHS